MNDDSRDELSDAFVLPDDDGQKRLADMVVDGSGILQRIADYNESLRDVIASISEDIGIDKKIARQMIVSFHKQNVEEVSSGQDKYQVLMECVNNQVNSKN